MPLFSNSNPDSPVEYSAVETGQTLVTDDEYERRSALGSGIESSRPSLEISDTEVNTSRNSAVLNREASPPSNDKTLHSYSGPTINGWPKAPRQLRGISVPLLVGDVLLILLPIAFLGRSDENWLD